MAWTFVQNTGEMFDSVGTLLATGYAGHGLGRNNGALQGVHKIGPLPVGKYVIGPLEARHDKLGQNVCPLIPDPGNEMYGRSAFYLHGRKSPTDLDASEGCIVLDHDPRLVVANSSVRDLEVTESLPLPPIS